MTQLKPIVFFANARPAAAEVFDASVPSEASTEGADLSVDIINAARRTMSLAQYSLEDLLRAEFVALGYDQGSPVPIASAEDGFILHLRAEIQRKTDAMGREDKSVKAVKAEIHKAYTDAAAPDKEYVPDFQI